MQLYAKADKGVFVAWSSSLASGREYFSTFGMALGADSDLINKTINDFVPIWSGRMGGAASSRIRDLIALHNTPAGSDPLTALVADKLERKDTAREIVAAVRRHDGRPVLPAAPKAPSGEAEQCGPNGYTAFETKVQEAIADLVGPDLAKPISTRVGSLHRAALSKPRRKRAKR